MINATLKQLAASSVGIQSLLAAKLPVKAKYAVSKLAGAIDRELETFNAARTKIFDDAGCTVVDKAYSHTHKELLANAIKDAEELALTEVEINALPLDIEQFGNADIEGPAFYALDWAMKPEAA